MTEQTRQALAAIKSNLMHQRRFGTDDLAGWRNACTNAEGDIEELIAALATPEGAAEQPREPDFIRRTNEEYAAWCKTFYSPEALDERGMQSLHGLWAWQEQERRKTAEQPPQPQAVPLARIEDA